jgi:DNA-binding HxlR family transcriptional regulator
MSSIVNGGRSAHHMEEIERKKVSKWIIAKLEERPYRWTELKSLIKQELDHDSTRYLTDILKSLQEKNMIIKQVISHKHTEYLLSGDFAKLQKSMQVHNTSLLAHQGSLQEIKTVCESGISLDKVTSLIGMNITGKLLNLLLGIEVYSRTSPVFKEHAENMIMSLVNQLGEYMVTSGKLSSVETDDAISIVNNTIKDLMIRLDKIANN